MANDHIQIEYLIHLNAINEKGQWWCTFRGKRSNSVELDSYNIQQKLTTTIHKSNLTNMKTVNKYETVIDITTPIDISPNLIQLIIGLVGVSIAFNIFFFIRCYTVKNYLKNLHIGHSRNNCLDQLLCIDQPRKLTPKTRLNYIQHVSPPETPKVTVKSPTTVATTIATTNEQWVEPTNMMTMIHNNPSPFVYHKSNSIPSSPIANYPILRQNQLQYTSQYPSLPQNSSYSKYPMHNSLMNPNNNNNGSSMEFIYDEVHNSVYTTTNSQPSDREKRKETTFQKFTNNTIRTVYDIGDWLIDRSGQIYIPYAQITPKPQRIIATLQIPNQSIKKNTKQSIKQIELNNNSNVFNQSITDITQIIDQKITSTDHSIPLCPHHEKPTPTGPPIKFLSRKSLPIQSKRSYTYKTNDNQIKIDNYPLIKGYKLADLEDWSMIDQD
ncbi:hypothetical protein Smp_163930 [Schistosoma mansoni]|uniref:hypothetical protein n=1 Tax=Schistosoma mansoni TaxID=6183 RepID=UPI0001A62395|nr:hypothetical protein Smp_163930 [Schistosoma mansoni]|eukprot:XP_018655652.1 hypothetical protein Smp_163930 [Schistosoma mansoni]